MAARYRLALATLLLMAACPPVTFCSCNRSRSPRMRGTGSDGTKHNAPLAGSGHGGAAQWPDALSPSASSESLPGTQPAPYPQPRISLLARLQPYLLVGWAIGVGLFALRLMIGAAMTRRLQRGRRPLDQAWAQARKTPGRAAGTAAGRGLPLRRVRQSLVTGLVAADGPAARGLAGRDAARDARSRAGPRVGPPAATGPLGDPLAAAGRSVSVLSPGGLVALRRLDREREMYCDSMAVAATGDRLAFTKALQRAVQGSAAGMEPAFGAAWKGSRNMTVRAYSTTAGRGKPAQRISWSAGAGRVGGPGAVTLSAVFAAEARSVARTRGDRTPTLAEIAKANETAWKAIRSVDMEYEMTDLLIVNGKKVHELRSPGLRWTKAGDRDACAAVSETLLSLLRRGSNDMTLRIRSSTETTIGTAKMNGVFANLCRTAARTSRFTPISLPRNRGGNSFRKGFSTSGSAYLLPR